MAHKGNIQLLITFVATPDKVAEVDRLVASHARWMAETHHREGSKALLGSRAASASTGNTRYVLSEVYESSEGIADHWQQAQASWSDFPQMVALIATCQPQTLHGGPIAASLW